MTSDTILVLLVGLTMIAVAADLAPVSWSLP